MPKILVRNGDSSRVGVDWRVVLALAALLVTVSTIAAGWLMERAQVSSHVTRDDAELIEWTAHKYNSGSLKHLTDKEYAKWLDQLNETNYRLARIEEELGIPSYHKPGVMPSRDEE